MAKRHIIAPDPVIEDVATAIDKIRALPPEERARVFQFASFIADPPPPPSPPASPEPHVTLALETADELDRRLDGALMMARLIADASESRPHETEHLAWGAAHLVAEVAAIQELIRGNTRPPTD